MIGRIVGRPLAYARQPQRSGDVRDSLASLDRAKRLLGYDARVSLEEGLRDTWTWITDGANTIPARLESDRLRRQTA